MMDQCKECFICCDSKSTFIERHFLCFFNIYPLDYPIIPLEHAYSCLCKTTFVHNGCLRKLKEINKCPLCRKYVNRANLHMEVYFEKYLIPHKYSILMLINAMDFLTILLYTCIIIIINAKNKYFLFLFCLLHSTVLFTIYSLEFIKRYWLYDENVKNFY